MNLKNIFSLVKETFKEYGEDKVPRLAAALAYYTVFSLAPLLVLIIAIASFFLGNNLDVQNQILGQIEATVGAEAADAIAGMIESSSQGGTGIVATIIGIVTLLFGATGVFGQLQDSLNTIWEVEPKGGGLRYMAKKRFIGFTMILGASFLLLVSLVVSTAVSALTDMLSSILGGLPILAQVVNFLVSTGIITLIFAMLFRYLPDVEIEWKDVWIGALVTALLFNVGVWLIGLYLANSSTASVYGAAGSLVIILLWVYYTAQILFIGAEFTQVYARRYGSKLTPEQDAQFVSDESRAKQGIPRRQPQGQAQREPRPVSSVEQVMIPVAGQPEIYREPGLTKTHIRHEPPQPERVVPVIALGAVAGVYTLRRIVRQLIPGRAKVKQPIITEPIAVKRKYTTHL